MPYFIVHLLPLWDPKVCIPSAEEGDVPTKVPQALVNYNFSHCATQGLAESSYPLSVQIS